MNLILKKLTRTFCPVLLAHSLDELTSIMNLFPILINPSHIVLLIFLYFCYVCYFIDGFFYPYVDIKIIKVLPRKSLGPLENVIHMICGSGFTEMFIIRSYLIYINNKYGKDTIEWLKVASNINKFNHPKLFAISKFLFFQIYMSVLMVVFINQAIKLKYEATSYFDCFVSITWIINNILLLRFTILDVPVIYLITYSCYLYVNERMNNLMLEMKNIEGNCNSSAIKNVVTKYKKLTRLICNVNPLIVFITFVNDLLVIPFIGVVIVTALTDALNFMQVLIKWCIFVAAAFYSVRGVIITIILAKIDSKSRVLHKSIASYCARGVFKKLEWQRQMVIVMEDLSCSRNQVAFKEISGSVTQIDLMENVISIVQFVMLLIRFSNQLVN